MADDLVTATWTLGDAADGLSRALAQLAAGDPNGRQLVRDELANARDLRSYYSGVAGTDFTTIDRLITQAQRATATVTTDAGGVRIGSVRIPWVGIIGGTVIVGAALWVAFGMRKQRRRRVAA